MTRFLKNKSLTTAGDVKPLMDYGKMEYTHVPARSSQDRDAVMIVSFSEHPHVSDKSVSPIY